MTSPSVEDQLTESLRRYADQITAADHLRPTATEPPARGRGVRWIAPALLAAAALVTAAVVISARDEVSDQVHTSPAAVSESTATGPNFSNPPPSVPLPESAAPLLWPSVVPDGYINTDAQIGWVGVNGIEVVAVAAHTDSDGAMQPLSIGIGSPANRNALPGPSAAQFAVGDTIATVQRRDRNPDPPIWDVEIDQGDRIILSSIPADGTSVEDLDAFFDAIDIAPDGTTTWRADPLPGWQIIATSTRADEPLPANILEFTGNDDNQLYVTVTTTPYLWNWLSLIDGPIRTVTVGSTPAWILGHNLLLITPDWTAIVSATSAVSDDQLTAVANSLGPVTAPQHATFHTTGPAPTTTTTGQLADPIAPRADTLHPVPDELWACFPQAANPTLKPSTFSGTAPYLPDPLASLMVLDRRGDLVLIDAQSVTWRRNQGYSWAASLLGGVWASRITDTAVEIERLMISDEPVASYPYTVDPTTTASCPISGTLAPFAVTRTGQLTVATHHIELGCPTSGTPLDTDVDETSTSACTDRSGVVFEQRDLSDPQQPTGSTLDVNTSEPAHIEGEADQSGAVPIRFEGNLLIFGSDPNPIVGTRGNPPCCNGRPVRHAAITDTTRHIAYTDDGTTLRITNLDDQTDDRALWTAPDPIQALAANDTAIAVAHDDHITIIDIATGTPYDIPGLQLNGIITIGYR